MSPGVLDGLIMRRRAGRFLTLAPTRHLRLTPRRLARARSESARSLDELPRAAAARRAPRRGSTSCPRTDRRRGRLPATSSALVGRVVARVVQLGRADRPARRRVEARRGRRHARPRWRPSAGARTCRRRRREQVDHALDRQPAAGHALAVDEREQRLDAGRAVADLVERHAGRGLGLFVADPVGHGVGRDQVERAVREPRPQRVPIGGGPQRRGDDVAARSGSGPARRTRRR